MMPTTTAVSYTHLDVYKRQSLLFINSLVAPRDGLVIHPTIFFGAPASTAASCINWAAFIVFSPHPSAAKCTIKAAKLMHDAAVEAGAPKNRWV